jgi:hypothetical protein
VLVVGEGLIIHRYKAGDFIFPDLLEYIDTQMTVQQDIAVAVLRVRRNNRRLYYPDFLDGGYNLLVFPAAANSVCNRLDRNNLFR